MLGADFEVLEPKAIHLEYIVLFNFFLYFFHPQLKLLFDISQNTLVSL